MKRFTVLAILMTLVLSACAGKKGNWGSLDVTIANQKTLEKQWQAQLVVTNPTQKTVPFQYNDKFQYTLHITQNGKEIYKQVFNPVKPPTIQNLTPNTSREHLVIWRYEDQAGKRVPAGTYEARVDLHAVTSGAQGAPKVVPVKIEVK